MPHIRLPPSASYIRLPLSADADKAVVSSCAVSLGSPSARAVSLRRPLRLPSAAAQSNVARGCPVTKSTALLSLPACRVWLPLGDAVPGLRPSRAVPWGRRRGGECACRPRLISSLQS